jgi:hypothetical protein
MLQSQVEKIAAGIALAIAAPVLFPVVKKVLQPVANLGVQGASALADKARYAAQLAREEIEDIVAEAQFEHMKRKLDREIMG